MKAPKWLIALTAAAALALATVQSVKNTATQQTVTTAPNYLGGINKIEKDLKTVQERVAVISSSWRFENIQEVTDKENKLIDLKSSVAEIRQNLAKLNARSEARDIRTNDFEAALDELAQKIEKALKTVQKIKQLNK